MFEREEPTYSRVRDLCELAVEHQRDNAFFLQAKRREKTIIKNEAEFFRFLSQTQGVDVKSFEDIASLLEPTSSRAQNIEKTGDSKSGFLRVFDNVVLVKKRGQMAKLYQSGDLRELDETRNFLAVENGETFLNVDSIADNFEEEYFVYLAGYANALTRNFLKTKEVTFFVDFDVVGMNIYESFECESKKLHVPRDIEKYFANKKYNNVQPYKKQRASMKNVYSKDVAPIIELIKKYDSVVEQEIIYNINHSIL